MKSISVPIGEIIAKETMKMEIRVTGVRFAKFRIWLGARIVKLAAFVIGCGIEIKGP